jgi:hypothetical protein
VRLRQQISQWEVWHNIKVLNNSSMIQNRLISIPHRKMVSSK